MNDPIKHHYNPQFYLRQWAGSDGRLFRYHRPHDRTVVSRLSPEHTGFEDRLYTLAGAADPQSIEKAFFSRVDNKAAPILELLIGLGPRLVIIGPSHLNNEQRSNWTRFINSLQLRGPHSLAEIKAVHDRIVRDNIERAHGAAYLASRQEGDPETVYEDALQQMPDELANAHKVLLTQLIDYQPVGQIIINMLWGVFDASAAPHTLLTSDRPYFTSHGLGDPACLLGVPLSPTRLFVAANDIRQLRKLAAQPLRDTVRNANNLVVRQAVRNVYGVTDGHLAFVDKRLRRPNEPPVPGLITRLGE
jgi:Protein of unknown function (DUF4238)